MSAVLKLVNQSFPRGTVVINFGKPLVLLKLICRVIKMFGVRGSSVVRAFAHGAMGHRINPSCGEPIELFLVPASAPRLV